MKHIGRRDFIVSAALIALSAPLWSRLPGDSSGEPPIDARWIGLPDAPQAQPTAPRTLSECENTIAPIETPSFVATEPVEFRTFGELTLVRPVPSFDERCAVYWKISEAQY